MAVTAEFWKGKRVFVTGHTGFKGSWLVIWLKLLGAKVCGYALPPSNDLELFVIADAAKDIENVYGDVRDKAHLASVLQDFQPDIVIHLAAQALVRESYLDPLGTYETNVLGVAYLLDAIRQLNSVRSVLVVTSDKTYENMEWDRGYRETDALGGHDPYSSSKACAEMVTSAYRRSFFSGDINCQIATARAGNVIGGGDLGKDRLVPDLLAGFASGKTVHIRNPHATRPWQHVLDPLHGYLILMQKMYEEEGFGTAWNFGPDDAGSKRVDWLADSLAKSWGVEGAWQSDDSEQPHEAVMLALDCSQARTRLGWRPRLDISQALALTVSWTKARIAEEDMSKVTEEQIRQYLDGSA